MSRQYSKLLIGVGVLWSAISSASTNEIPSAYRETANHYGIPPAILYAIALTESGTAYQSALQPWPWTLNINGKGYFFNSRISAYRQLQAAIQKGDSVDICLMQINWHWHHHRFTDLWSSLDPFICLAVGANVLQEQYIKTLVWWSAVGRYHAPSPDKASRLRAERYRQRVKHHWKRIAL
jgi:hypothetical protein